MRKILLGTTGLVAATAMFASAASADQTPKVTIGGFADFQAGYVTEDNDAGQRSHGFRNDTEVSIRVDGKSSMGLGYGAVIDLEADVTADADGEGLNAARTYVYLDGNWGRFELGSNEGASETMRVDATSLAAATGGIDGAWRYFANSTGGAFITRPQLPIAHGSLSVLTDESQENANKITYYSPRMHGFQVGLSYLPDSTDRGQLLTRSDVNGGAGEIFDGAINYDNQFGNFHVSGALAGQFGDAESAGSEDLMAYNAGGMVGYAGFHVAGSYGDWSDSLAGSTVEGSYWTAGIGYDYGAFGTSVTYLDSSYETAGADNDFTNLVVGADYNMAPGLTPYAEVSIYEFDAVGTLPDNDGTVVILGTQLAF